MLEEEHFQAVTWGGGGVDCVLKRVEESNKLHAGRYTLASSTGQAIVPLAHLGTELWKEWRKDGDEHRLHLLHRLRR